MVRTPPFQGENPGSNPSGAAKIKSDPFGSFFILRQSPDENRRFDTIVGKNKRNTLRDVRALRVVSNANNPSGAATMSSRAIYRDASGMPRRAVPERNYYDHQMVVFLFCVCHRMGITANIIC